MKILFKLLAIGLLPLAFVQTAQADSDCPRYPVFVECPDNTFGHHCDTLHLQVRAEDPTHHHPNNRNIRYHLISGPGEINARSGEWTWHWDGEDSRLHFLVEIAASIGNSKKHMTPTEEYCRFRVWLDDEPDVILVDGKESNSVFFVPAPGVHHFDIEVDDPDECDSTYAEILSVQPDVGPIFYVEDGQLVFVPEAIHDGHRFVVTLVNGGSPRPNRHQFIFDTRENPVPVFEECPGDIAITVCDALRLAIRAVDAMYRDAVGIRLELVSGPGEIWRNDSWTFVPSDVDIGQTYEVEIVAHYGHLVTPPEESCRFSVTVNDLQTGIQSLEFACGDSITIPNLLPSLFRLRACDLDCHRLDLSVSNISPPFAGTIDIDRRRRMPFYAWDTHVLQITPDSADFGETYHLTIESAGDIDQHSCEVTFTVERAQPYRVRIETLSEVAQGQRAYLNVVLEEANVPLNSFDFKLAYDGSAIAAIKATPGEFLTECGWESLYYQHGPFEPRMDGEPYGQFKVSGRADGPYGTAPTCFLPENLPATLFTIDFLVTDDRTYECTFIPVQFYWQDCRDNTVHPPSPNISFLSNEVHDFEGSLLPHAESLPGYFGAPDECLVDPRKYRPHRLIDFYNGGLDIVCADSIDQMGDINLNGVSYEVADVVLFTNYFVYGDAVLNMNYALQAQASDVNRDGLLLTVEDLQWMILVVEGDIGWFDPYDTTSPNEAIFRQDAGGTIEVLTPDTLGVAWLIFEGIVQPVLATDGMEIKWNYDGVAHTTVLVYSLEGHGFTAGPVIANTTVPLLEAHTCTYNGAKVEAIIDQALDADDGDNGNLPERFAVGQNYPNPFNSSTAIRFDLPHAGEVSFTVYNVLGKVVYRESQSFPAGRHRLAWDGRNAAGGNVASGIYFYRIEAGAAAETKKMLLLK